MGNRCQVLIFAPIWFSPQFGSCAEVQRWGDIQKGGIQIYLNHVEVEVESRARKGCVQPDLTLN